MANELNTISEAIDIAANQWDTRLAQHQIDLGEPILFIPSEECEGHGQGWFKQGDQFVSYWKYSNGFALTPMYSIPTDLVRQLMNHL